MNCGEDELSPLYVSSYPEGPYGSSLASSASSSSASVWSDASSQSSDDSSVHSSVASSECEISEAFSCNRQDKQISQSDDLSVGNPPRCLKLVSTSVPLEQRKHPRRSSNGVAGRSGCPPSLVRQCDRKINFVDGLVDLSAQIVEAIWPLSSVACRNEADAKGGVLPLRTFIQETLRRSRTSYSTLQVALYYLILIKPHVPKYDFTMEQPEDAHSIRALQCGRRMFLAALILASKYLQDRNYSSRAWSKISGLNTQEINQNEMAFLIAVNWKLHITDSIFRKWTDIVLKYTPTHPPSPSSLGTRATGDLCSSWKEVIVDLHPELDNVGDIIPSAFCKSAVQSISTLAKPFVERSLTFETESNESTPTPRYYTPPVMEPPPVTAVSSSKAAPALGLLPTPRLTPQGAGFNTPAASATSCIRSSMGYAMAQVSAVCASQAIENWPVTSSPQPFSIPRRSSLANSISSMSSPESMISDTSSRSSRRSSVSSASSLVSAPMSSKLDVQARCRYAKHCCDRQSNRMTIPTVPESDSGCTSSPESYTGHVGKDFLELTLETPMVHEDNGSDFFSHDLATDAARALQDLHNNSRNFMAHMPSRAGAKRSRPGSEDSSLQDNVREMLASRFYTSGDEAWSGVLVRSRSSGAQARTFPGDIAQDVSRCANGRKRVCCSTDALSELPEPHHSARPGMWEGILH